MMPSYCYIVLVFVTFVTPSRSHYPICKTQINSCSCETNQGLVDLSPLDPKYPFHAQFTNIADGEGNDFAYNPCSPFTDVKSLYCNEVAACHTIPYDGYSIGEQDGATFETHPKDGLRIKYPTTDGSRRTTYVALKCDPSQEGSLTAIGKDHPDSSIYKFTLTSKYACPVGGGGGFPWELVIRTLCVVLAVTCLALIIYIICTKCRAAPSGGASGQSYYSENVARETKHGYKQMDSPVC